MDVLLEPLGLGSVESELYLVLIDNPQTSLSELAALTGDSAARLRRPLARLIDSGLVTRLAGTPARYLPAPPEVAVDALVLRRRQDLESLRAAARELGKRLDIAPNGRTSELIELVDGQAAIRRQLARIQLGAESEVCIVDCPPYMSGHPEVNPPEMQALARGVRYRAIYHAPSIAAHHRSEEILRSIGEGEQARALPDIRMKMIIADGRVAMLPLSFKEAETGVRILVHPSPLLSTITACFEMLWERATPIGPSPDPELSDLDRQILLMLAAGTKDKTISRALDLADRTLTRRITALMTALDATTRFQAALQAARRGWI